MKPNIVKNLSYLTISSTDIRSLPAVKVSFAAASSHCHSLKANPSTGLSHRPVSNRVDTGWNATAFAHVLVGK